MGTLVAVFAENKGRFFACHKIGLGVESARRVRASRYRYCLGADQFYIPLQQEGLDERDRLCWVRDREYFSLEALNAAYDAGELHFGDVRIGNTYLRRHKEVDGIFTPVQQFVGRELYEALQENPEALPSVSKSEFEGLCAELFVKRGFEVDLFRSVKDGGIDFLAVKNDDTDPIIYAVQCKQPDIPKNGRRRKALGRPVVQQIYGAAKAWDLAGAVAISGHTYSDDAKKFSELKPEEIQVYNQSDIIAWLQQYRWNADE